VFNLAQENGADIKKIADDFAEVNEMLVRIAIIQFMIEESECLKCKIKWFEYGDYLVAKFKNYSFQVLNK